MLLIVIVRVMAVSRNAVTYKGDRLLTWEVMLLDKQGETAFFNAPLFENDANSPWKIKMEIYALGMIMSLRTLPAPMTMSIKAYKDGEMYIEKEQALLLPENNRNFYNRGGLSCIVKSLLSVLIN